VPELDKFRSAQALALRPKLVVFQAEREREQLGARVQVLLGGRVQEDARPAAESAGAHRLPGRVLGYPEPGGGHGFGSGGARGGADPGRLREGEHAEHGNLAVHFGRSGAVELQRAADAVVADRELGRRGERVQRRRAGDLPRVAEAEATVLRGNEQRDRVEPALSVLAHREQPQQVDATVGR